MMESCEWLGDKLNVGFCGCLSYAHAAMRTSAWAHEIGTGRPQAAAFIFVQSTIRQYATVGAAIQHMQRMHETINRYYDQASRNANGGPE
jgi:hypothetical protein